MSLKVVSEPVHDCVTCTRRTLLHGIGIAVAGSLVACGGSGSGDIDAATGKSDAPPVAPDAPAACPAKDLCLDLTMAKYAALKNVGGSVLVQTANDLLIVVRTTTTAAVALSAICTHQGCTVNYQSSNKVLYCPCHGAEFSMTGAVVAGPTNTPVKAYATTLSGTTITIVLA